MLQLEGPALNLNKRCGCDGRGEREGLLKGFERKEGQVKQDVREFVCYRGQAYSYFLQKLNVHKLIEFTRKFKWRTYLNYFKQLAVFGKNIKFHDFN